LWSGNFRDLSASITRMATLTSGSIDNACVDAEIARLRTVWSPRRPGGDVLLEAVLGPERFEQLDLFDRVQLAEVIRICRASPSLSAAGRTLFAASLRQRRSTNDADRLRKYLQRFDLTWGELG